MDKEIRALALRDGRYSPEAFRFLFESLQHAVKLAGKEQATEKECHVTGQEVLLGMRTYASEIFGPLAGQVWRAWGVNATIDWGHVVFLLVDSGLLNRQETDTIDDFQDGFDFDAVFVDGYHPALPTNPDDLGSGEPF